jgi:protein-S-isoprenylcysteine O-methyltransferase Ste14
LTFGGEETPLAWCFSSIRSAKFFASRRHNGLVAIQPEHRLVTSEPHAVIRHQNYFATFVLSLGWALAFRPGVGVILAVLTLVVVLARIDAEERLLSETFGAEYDAYRTRTWRVIPYVYLARPNGAHLPRRKPFHKPAPAFHRLERSP